MIAALATAGGLCAGAGLFSWGAVAPSAQLFGPTLRRINDPHAIALTFDDGPNPAVTPYILDLLERYGATATFFQIGEYVRRFPVLSKEVVHRGHAIGNHTDTHPRLIFLSSAQITGELEICSASLELATGCRSQWMRPPYGYRGPQLQHALQGNKSQMQVVMWSASGHDWTPQSPAKLINRLRRVAGGDIVLLHDGDHRNPKGDRSHTIAALEYWIPRWKDAGIRLISLDRLSGENN